MSYDGHTNSQDKPELSFKARQILNEIRDLKEKKEQVEAEIAQYKRDNKDSWYDLKDLRERDSAIFKKLSTAYNKYRKLRLQEDNATLL